MIAIAFGLLLIAVVFVTGWAIGLRRATAERIRWHYVNCAAFIGLRKCLDEQREDLRDYMTAEAQIQYRLWQKGPRVNPPPFSLQLMNCSRWPTGSLQRKSDGPVSERFVSGVGVG